MLAIATVVELEQPLVLAPGAAARYLGISKRGPRLIAEGKIIARERRPRTLLGVVASLKAHDASLPNKMTTRRSCSAAAVTCAPARAELRQ